MRPHRRDANPMQKDWKRRLMRLEMGMARRRFWADAERLEEEGDDAGELKSKHG